MKVSEWQKGVPPCDGIWVIYVPEHKSFRHNGRYFARYKGGVWGRGYWSMHDVLPSPSFVAYPPNNDPENPRKWRGLVDE